MIEGEVNALHEATLRVVIYDRRGLCHEVAVILDTGFSGALTLPRDLVAALDLEWSHSGLATLADGSEISREIYLATIEWDGSTLNLEVDEAETSPLLGMAILVGYEVNIEVRLGGRVRIEALR